MPDNSLPLFSAELIRFLFKKILSMFFRCFVNNVIFYRVIPNKFIYTNCFQGKLVKKEKENQNNFKQKLKFSFLN